MELQRLRGFIKTCSMGITEDLREDYILKFLETDINKRTTKVK